MYKFLCPRLAGNRYISERSYTSQQQTAVAQQTVLIQHTTIVKFEPGQNISDVKYFMCDRNSNGNEG